MNRIFLIAVAGAAVMAGTSIASADDCRDEVNAPNTMPRYLAAQLVKTVDNKELAENPTKVTADAWVDAIAKATESVVDRKAGPIVYAYARGQSDAVLKTHQEFKKSMDQLKLIKDENTRKLMILNYAFTPSTGEALLAPIEIILNAALSSCNK